MTDQKQVQEGEHLSVEKAPATPVEKAPASPSRVLHRISSLTAISNTFYKEVRMNCILTHFKIDLNAR